DTSVAVAAMQAGHSMHAACVAAVRRYRPALAGHAAYETFSVLTRLPGDAKLGATTARAAIRATFHDVVWLTGKQSAALLNRLAVVGITGGGVYDALVGEAARVNGHTLLTCDARARTTYDVLGVPYLLVAS
ncbi:MAG TPA: PIN domain-containing protein, partial [Ilumatobacteraceae bacterium]|nr:PIN domain-containing protein [Ilumatobacteraceae bacterium]